MRKIEKWLTEKKLKAQGWISVHDRMPETTSQTITITEENIATGELGKTEVITAEVSEVVAILHDRCMGGKFEKAEYIDYTINGSWANTIEVTHWRPIKKVEELKGD